MTDPSSRQRERPTSTNLQPSDSNKDLVVSPTWALYSTTDWPTDRYWYRDRTGELGKVLEIRQSKVIEEEMTRKLHSDLK
jgi:hypothetical protein